MRKAYLKSKLELLNLIIVLLLSYILSCAAADKLLLFNVVIKDSICNHILRNMWWVAVILFLLYLINYCILDKKSKEKFESVIYNNLCKSVFIRYIKTNETEDKLMRITLFKAFRRNTAKPYLKMVGRYQTKLPKKICKIKFYPGKGCAGIAYQFGHIIHRSIKAYDHNNADHYYKESKKIFNLSEKKARRLNEKACDFLCIPIKFFREEESWGVLSVDSMKEGTFTDELARKIENDLISFSAILMI